MTFVYPILLGGLIAAGVPVLLHFLIRQKPRTLPFPAFRFLLLKKRSNTRKLRLRNLLLMLLRVALVAILCLALARPRLFHEQIGLSRERPVALMLVFDTSPSMEYKTSEVTRLELAKKRSLELLDQLPDDCRILVVDTGAPEQIERDDWIKSRNLARQKINGLTIRPGSGPVTQAVQALLRRLEAWDRSDDDVAGQSYPRFLCVFSDRTRVSWDDSQAAKIRTALARESSVKTQILFFDVGVDEPTDLAITQVDLPITPEGGMQQSFPEGEKIVLRVSVKATGKDLASTLICQIGKHEMKQGFEIPAGATQTIPLEIDSEAWDLKPGFHQAEVRFATGTDALSFNNRRYVTFAIHKKPTVLVLADDVKKAGTFQRGLEALLYTAKVRSVKEKLDFPLGEYAAVFLDGVAAPTDDLWRMLTTYVQQGGGLGIIPPGDELKEDAYNSEAARRIMPAAIRKKATSPDLRGSVWDMSGELRHPFLLPYVRWYEAGSNDIVEYPPAARHFWEVRPYAEGSTIVRYESADAQAPPAVVERAVQRPTGKVLLLTTPMDEQAVEWNDYGQNRSSFYVGLTKLCVRYLRKDADNPALNFVFGEEPPIVKLTRTFPKYVLSGPDFSEEVRFDESQRWIGDRLPRAGNYTLAGTNAEKEDPQTLAQFSINIPGAESDLSRIPAEEIVAAFGRDALIAQDGSASILKSLEQYWNEPIELFPWLMLVLLFLFAGENLLANRFYRQERET